MKEIVELDNGKRAILDTKNDEVIINTSWANGRENTRGEDLMLHKTQGGKNVFYAFSWSRWQGEGYSAEYLTPEQVVAFVAEHMYYVNDATLKRLAELGIAIEETA